MKQRIACLVLVDLRDSIGRPSDEDTAALLCRTGIIPTTRSAALKTIKAMVDAGHRHRNLQHESSRGLALVLGISLPEHWSVCPNNIGKISLTSFQLDQQQKWPCIRCDENSHSGHEYFRICSEI
jgi:hypothetical protein